jgi:sec-independent protein translocase protein TatC
VAVLTGAKTGRKERNEEKRLELTEHLGELRSRIMRCFLYMAIGGGVCYYRFKPIYRFLFRPMERAMEGHGEWKIVFTHFPQAFMVVLQVSLVAGIIITAPLLTMEAWGFLGPALTREEKKPLRFIAPLSVVLFAAGVALAYWVSQYAIGWFVSFVSEFPQGVLYQEPKAYVMFMLKMMGVFGLVFQLPVVLAFLAWIGILKSANMKKTWRHAVLGISIVGLVITPANDIFSMAVMIIPVIFLYLGSIWLVQFIEKKRNRDRQ